MYYAHGVPPTSTGTQHPHPPSQLGHDHAQSAGLLLLQLLFLHRALQERGCYRRSDRNLFDAVYEAAQLEKLSCTKALAAKREELAKTRKKLENMESVYRRRTEQADLSNRSCDQEALSRQTQLVCKHTPRAMVQKPIKVEQGTEFNLLQSMSQFLDAFSKDTGGLCNKDNALITAVRLGDAVATQLILDTGANVSAVPTRANLYQRTPLHWAAAEGHKDVVEALLEYGADLEAKTTGGSTPLHLAVRDNADKEVIRTLLRNGADIDACDSQGRTALHLAAQTGDLALMELLLEYGADPQARYGDQHITPIKVATMYGHRNLVQWLKQFENQEPPLYRQLPLPETDTAHHKFRTEEPITTTSEAFLQDSKDVSPQTSAAGIFSNTTDLPDF